MLPTLLTDSFGWPPRDPLPADNRATPAANSKS